MSRTNIVVLLLVAVLMGTLFSVFTTNSESVVFARAFAEPGIEFKVSGTLDTDHAVVPPPTSPSAPLACRLRGSAPTVLRVVRPDAP